MKNLPEIYQLRHRHMLKECTMQDNHELCMALLMKLYLMQGKYIPDAPGSREKMTTMMEVEAKIIIEQLAKHTPSAQWSLIVEVCETAILEEEKPRVTVANIIRWVKAGLARKNTSAVNRYQKHLAENQPVDIEKLHERYIAQVSLWAHNKPLFDAGSLALLYLTRSGRLSVEPSAEEMKDLESYIAAEKSRRASSARSSGLRGVLQGLQEQSTGLNKSIINIARLQHYIENHEDKQEWKEKLPCPTSVLG
jgi:hypothetical protein